MPDKAARESTKDQKVVFLRSLSVIVAIILLFQLFSRSVVDHRSILASAKSQQLTQQSVEPERGKIYLSSSDGQYPVAITQEVYDISLVPKNIKNKHAVANKLADILGLDSNDIYQKINNDKVYLPPIAKRIDKSLAQKIIDLNLAGVLVQPTYARYYPENNLASQILGFVDYSGTGRYGIEGYYDDELRGKGGVIQSQKDAKGRAISFAGNQEQTQNGDTLILSVDQNVENMAQQKLDAAIKEYKAQSGSISIVDVKTGAIIAMAASPNFDPNKFNDIKAEDQSNFINPVIGSLYEPGSIFKPLIVAAGIDSGKLDPNLEGDYAASVDVQGYTIHTATFKAFGHEDVTQALENSDNVALVSYANIIGNQTIHDYLQKMGIGAKYGIDSSGESTGKLKPANSWSDILRATTSFGQGIAVTPLQILMDYQMLGNGGELVQPYLVSKIIKPDGSIEVTQPKMLRRVVSEKTADIVRNMLIKVVTNGEGKRAGVDGYVIGGKTGTAQVADPDGKGYLENAHIGSFAGLVPADKPQFAMLVKLDRPTTVNFAESSAAPTFSEMAKFLLQYYQIPPSS